jgi:hypothetical protein
LSDLEDSNVIDVVRNHFSSFNLSDGFLEKVLDFNTAKVNGQIGKGELFLCIFLKDAMWRTDKRRSNHIAERSMK